MRAFAGRVLAPLMMLGLSAGAAVAQTPTGPVNLTAFAGAAMVPDAHAVSGIGVGVRPQPGPVSIEFEYSRSRSDPTRPVPAIVTLAGNFLVQVPVRQSRFELYGAFGVGFYVLQPDPQSGEDADSAWNFGGGAKVTLAGPLKLRIDYRVFRLAASPGRHHSDLRRLSVGIVAGF
jgi:hypothetical protein